MGTKNKVSKKTDNSYIGALRRPFGMNDVLNSASGSNPLALADINGACISAASIDKHDFMRNVLSDKAAVIFATTIALSLVPAQAFADNAWNTEPAGDRYGASLPFTGDQMMDLVLALGLLALLSAAIVLLVLLRRRAKAQSDKLDEMSQTAENLKAKVQDADEILAEASETAEAASAAAATMSEKVETVEAAVTESAASETRQIDPHAEKGDNTAGKDA